MGLNEPNWNAKFFHTKNSEESKFFYCDLETINPNPNRRSDIMEVMQFIIYISTCFFVSAMSFFVLVVVVIVFFFVCLFLFFSEAHLMFFGF